MSDCEKIISLTERVETLENALADLIYICESSDKAIDCLCKEFTDIKKVLMN